MSASKRTKSLRKKKNLFLVLDILTWVGIAIFTFIVAFAKYNAKDTSGAPIFSDDFKKLLVSLGVTTVVGMICALVIKDKARTAVWMLSLLICTIVYKTVGMYCILAAWFIDEYVFHLLYKHYKERLVINKEIDLRNE